MCVSVCARVCVWWWFAVVWSCEVLWRVPHMCVFLVVHGLDCVVWMFCVRVVPCACFIVVVWCLVIAVFGMRAYARGRCIFTRHQCCTTSTTGLERTSSTPPWDLFSSHSTRTRHSPSTQTKS